MASLKFPYELGGYVTIAVGDVNDVIAGSDIVIKTDIPAGAGNVVGTTLTYKNATPTALDLANLEHAILVAAQTPGSCNIYTLTDDDGTDDDYYIAAASGVTVSAV